MLAGQVGAQAVAEALCHHVVLPDGDSVLRRAILLVAKHIVESPAEVGVARRGDGGHQGQRRGMSVAAHPQSAVDEAVRTGIRRTFLADDALLEEGQCLCRLEGRAGRIGTHDGAVQQGLLLVLLQQVMVASALPADEQVGIEGGRRHQAEDFACLGFDGHDRAYLVLHQAFAQHLEVDVDAQLQVFAGDGRAVQFAVHVVSLDAAVGIAQQDFHALLASEILLVALLDALLADVVAAAVVVVLLDVAAGHLADVAQGMARGVVGILPDGAPLDGKSGKLVELLLEDAALLGRELGHEHLLGVAGVAGILAAVLDVGHQLVELFAGDVQRAAEVGGVQVGHLAGDKGHVVGGLVEHQQLAVAVVDGAARRILHLVEEGVVVGILLVFVRQNLQVEEADQVHQHDEDSRTCNHVFPFLQIIVFWHRFIF